MRLTDKEQAWAAGEGGPARQWAIRHQIAVGRYLGAADLVPVSQAHIMADTESLGVAGVELLERFAADGARVVVPTITDPRGTDLAAAAKLRQQDWMVALERRAIAAFQAMDVLMTDTCVNYQTIMPAVLGEHMAYGDTGVVIYTNSVLGARSNFEGGPSALAAGLTGRTPRYGFHLEQNRRATLAVRVERAPDDLADWGALGGLVGRLAGDYSQVPAVLGIDRVPGSDEMKHFGAAAASYGSVALFHMAGVTPEAEHMIDPAMAVRATITAQDIATFRTGYAARGGPIDVVVFAAPQLSLMEMQAVARLLDGRHVRLPTLVVTSPQVRADADRMGLTERLEKSGATVLSGMCFYQSYAREMAEANNWRGLATNSAKLVNILGGYGYAPALMPMGACVDVACGGRA